MDDDDVEGLYGFCLHGRPIPDGWKFAGELEGHHGHYRFLIKKKEGQESNGEKDGVLSQNH